MFGDDGCRRAFAARRARRPHGRLGADRDGPFRLCHGFGARRVNVRALQIPNRCFQPGFLAKFWLAKFRLTRLALACLRPGFGPVVGARLATFARGTFILAVG